MRKNNYIILTKEDIAVRITAESAIDALISYSSFISLWHITPSLFAKTVKVLSIPEAITFFNSHILDGADAVKSVYANYDTIFEGDEQ